MTKTKILKNTKLKILNAALKTWPDVRARTVADKVGLTHAAVLYHFKNQNFRDCVAEHAVKTGCSRVIVSLIAMSDKSVKNLTSEERQKHFESVK
ncbi:MAG: hypothetical protein CMC15_18695 [Flavobacteriaceae bacterium]|nr:hypothetical protein [Flavobacteriaceae bacterium]|tara:strand:- start:680 stop:964 length:285 start_codon:yes stop_codon:yes gene_type:complete